jgi:hypothetical protein
VGNRSSHLFNIIEDAVRDLQDSLVDDVLVRPSEY